MALTTTAVLDIVDAFVRRVKNRVEPVGPETLMRGDESALNLDSLQTAELSATLEDELGSDPFSEGLLPETVGEIIEFYVN